MKFIQNRFIKFSAISLLFVLVAIQINLSNRIVNPWDRMQHVSFWILTIPLALLLVGYACLITFLYYHLSPGDTGESSTDQKEYPSPGLYAMLSVGLVSLMQLAFVNVLVKFDDVWDEIYRYATVDFPYFVVPLLTYVYLVYRYPELRMYRQKTPISQRTDASEIPSSYPNWKEHNDVRFLQVFLIERLGYHREIPLEDIRFFDIFCITSSRTKHFIYLVNGEKIAVHFTTASVAEWELGDWFLKTNNGILVNMVHVVYPITDWRLLQIDKRLWENMAGHTDRAEIDNLLRVSRRLSNTKLKDFVVRMRQLKDSGWEKKLRI